MSLSSIKKRNGAVVDFDRGRIEAAIEKASEAAASEVPPEDITLLVDNIVSNMTTIYADSMPDVESIQDLVEQELMRSGHYKTARAYIIYRDTQKNRRQHAVARSAEQLEQSALNVTRADGTTERFSYAKLVRQLLDVAGELEEAIDIDALAQLIKTNLYDGISTSELENAMIMAAKSCIEQDTAYSQLAARLLLSQIYDETLELKNSAELKTAYANSLSSTIRELVRAERLDNRLLDFDLKALGGYLVPERDNLFDFMGLHMAYDRYFIQEEGRGQRLEAPQVFWMRIAMGLAINEDAKTRDEWAKKFYDTISQLLYVPSTPTLFHSGTTFAQLSSCFLNTVEDDLKHIFKVYLDTALMSKFSGGIATDWTNIRGTGSLIKTVNIPSQGVIPFLKIANDTTVAISRSGKRKGATCAYLETWHLDIEDFLELRKNTGDERRRTHDMNTANWIPDLFMKRVEADAPWTLFSPSEVTDLHDLYGQAFEKRYQEYERLAAEGKIKSYKTVSATGLWRKMLTMLFETGHPWITFKDACNVRSPQDHVGVVHNSNLCTEITLNNSADETAVCNLGSVNLARHVSAGKLDKKLVAETVELAMRMLDNVVDINYYTTKECRYSNLRHRPVGLGIMGFADALYLLDINFASDEAVAFADESMELISYHAIMGSSRLAKEKGAYETFAGSKWDRGIFPLDTLALLEKERGTKIDVERTSQLDWQPVREHVKRHGMRNSNTMAIAPTASISNISGCYPCIEPIYKNLYVKSNMSGDFTVINSYLIEDLKKHDLWTSAIVEQIKFHDGSIQKIEAIPAELRAKYQEVFEIDPDWLVKIAAYRGKWIDQSQSLNIFVRGVSGKKLSDIYQYAWSMGLKTTYYLRSLAASQVEKSTVDAVEVGQTHQRDFATT